MNWAALTLCTPGRVTYDSNCRINEEATLMETPPHPHLYKTSCRAHHILCIWVWLLFVHRVSGLIRFGSVLGYGYVNHYVYGNGYGALDYRQDELPYYAHSM